MVHQSRDGDINKLQDRVASNDSQSRYEHTKARKKDLRENKNLVEKDNVGKMKNKMKEDIGGARSDEEGLDNGPSKATAKSKGRKWKLQTRNTKRERANNITLI